jgi:predicted glycosyltransferase
LINTKPFHFLKPIIPRRTQIFLRRILINLCLHSCRNVWPIDPKSAIPPEGWTGWPENKKFALVLTHDVDTQAGADNCHLIAEIEERLGFRSSFNFVAEDYTISKELINSLKTKGFEIGQHSIHHNNPFISKEYFKKLAVKINKYLKDWDAVGFRSPSMYHNLELIHNLKVEYDASTFDTDPFEPQPDGVGTIFPFWVSGNYDQKGYVELPYTLPQDFLIFILLQQNNIDIWTKKLDWIAEKGGMALFIIHPDYISFNGNAYYEKYPVKYYEEFLTYIKTKYKGQYWHVLPRDIARFWATNYRGNNILSNGSKKEKKKEKIWIDLDNTPHIPFFKPIIIELNKRGYECLLTARDAYQVIALADRFGLKYKKIGHHYGKNKILKVLGLIIRSLELIPTIMKQKPVLAISHGSRTQVVVAKLLGIPSMTIYDYEYTQSLIFFSSKYEMTPEIIPDNSTKRNRDRVTKYPGIKEDVYVSSYIPDPTIMTDLKMDDKKVIVTVRPPATEAHYFCQASGELFEAAMQFLLQKEDVQLILIPRNKKQEDLISKTWPSAIATDKIIIPDHAINGLDLMWFSDLVISGGGTMNREAAALGVPVCSIFRGTIGAVDNYLSEKGRLVLLESSNDLGTKIKLIKRDKNFSPHQSEKKALNTIVNKIVEILQK